MRERGEFYTKYSIGCCGKTLMAIASFHTGNWHPLDRMQRNRLEKHRFTLTDQVIVTAERPRGEAEGINIERTSENIVQVLPSQVIVELLVLRKGLAR